MHAKPLVLVAALLSTQGCVRAFAKFTVDSQLGAVTVTPSAVIRGQGCLTVAGANVSNVRAARIGVDPAPIQLQDGLLRVCPAANTAVGRASLDLQTESFTRVADVTVLDGALALGPLAQVRVVPRSTLELSGVGFDGGSAANHLVTFTGGVAGIVTLATSERLLVQVPDDARSGPVSVSLLSRDPPSEVALTQAITVIQRFSVVSAMSERNFGPAFAGERVRLALDVSNDELALASPVVTVAPKADASVADPASVVRANGAPNALDVQLPEGLRVAPGEFVSVCVSGDINTDCIDVEIAGVGHSNLIRAPKCDALNFGAMSGPMATYRFGPESPAIKTAVLDADRRVVFWFTADGVLEGLAALPIDGDYASLVVNAFQSATLDRKTGLVHLVDLLAGTTSTFQADAQARLFAPTYDKIAVAQSSAGVTTITVPSEGSVAVTGTLTSLSQFSSSSSQHAALLNGTRVATIDFTTNGPTLVSDASVSGLSTGHEIEVVPQTDLAIIGTRDGQGMVARLGISGTESPKMMNVAAPPDCSSVSGIDPTPLRWKVAAFDNVLGGFRYVASGSPLASSCTVASSGVLRATLSDLQGSGALAACGVAPCIEADTKTLAAGEPILSQATAAIVGTDTLYARTIGSGQDWKNRLSLPAGFGVQYADNGFVVRLSRDNLAIAYDANVQSVREVAFTSPIAQIRPINASAFSVALTPVAQKTWLGEQAVDTAGNPAQAPRAVQRGVFVSDDAGLSTVSFVEGPSGAMIRTPYDLRTGSGAPSNVALPDVGCEQEPAVVLGPGFASASLQSILTTGDGHTVATCMHSSPAMCPQPDPTDANYVLPAASVWGPCIGAPPPFTPFTDYARPSTLYAWRLGEQPQPLPLCGEDARAVQLVNGPTPARKLLLWSIAHPPAGPDGACATRTPGEERVYLASVLDTPTPFRLTAVGETLPVKRIVYDWRFGRWIFVVRTEQGGWLLKAIDQETKQISLLRNLAHTVEDLELSPDAKRIYEISDGGVRVRIYANEQLPVYYGAAELTRPSRQIMVSSDGGAALLAGVGGVCTLSD